MKGVVDLAHNTSNHKMNSRAGLSHAKERAPEAVAPGPNGWWFAEKSPIVHNGYGSALQTKEDRQGQKYVADISEDFFAATLGSEGSPAAPTVYVPDEGCFYTYNRASGLYTEQTEHTLAARLSTILLRCAQEAGQEVNVGNLIYCRCEFSVGGLAVNYVQGSVNPPARRDARELFGWLDLRQSTIAIGVYMVRSGFQPMIERPGTSTTGHFRSVQRKPSDNCLNSVNALDVASTRAVA